MGLSNLRTLPRRFALLGAALLCLAAGCAQMGSARVPLTRIIRGPFGSQPSQPPADHYVGHLTVQGGKGPQGRDAYLPPPKDQPTGQAKDPLPVARLGFSLNADPNKVVPINLDTVLRLAEGQNGQTAIARAKLEAAQANVDLAAKAWLPDLWVGTGWYRHDGGIANEDGTLLHSSFSSMFAGLELHGNVNLRDAVFAKVDAERRVWQQKAEVSKLTSDALLEATATYMDLLTARAAEAVSVESEGKLRELLDKTTALAKSLPQFEVEVVRVRGELTGQQQLTRRFREGMLAATAKLIYLLGLDPSSELAVMDRRLVAF